MRQATCLKDEVLKFQLYDDPYMFILSFILNEFFSRFATAVPFILPTPLFRRDFHRKRFFLLEFYFKFISILHRVNN
jgi:hypothetical protein